MPIPASHIVSIEPRVITGGSSNLEMNGLFLTKNPMISASTLALEFTTASAVGDYFGTASVEYETAATYFTSYDNKFAAPMRIMFALRVDEALPAWVRGAATGHTLAEYAAVTDGALVITVDGMEHEVSGLDLSEATSLSDVADKIAAAIGEDVTCEYSSLTKAFTVTCVSTGADSTITYASSPEDSEITDLAAMMGLREDDGAILSAGMDATDEAGQLEAIRKVTENWVSFTTLWEPEDEEVFAWAKWASNNYGWLYVPFTMSAKVISADSDTDIASQLKDGGYDHVACIYGSLAYAAFVMGCVASIPWSRTNGAVTLAFKSQSGLAALVTDETTATVLEGKNCSYYGKFASRNGDFALLYDSKLAASDYGYIDAYVNSIWLNNRLQSSILDGLKASPRVPYTDRGYTMIRAWMMDPVNEARNNGVVEPGVTLSESQKSELFSEAGMDISDMLWTQGFFIQILDPGASVRAQRGTPVISLWYTYGGSVHKIDVASTVVL